MTSKLVPLKDYESGDKEFIELSSGRVFSDAEGLHFLRKLEETEFVLGDYGRPICAPNGTPISVKHLSRVAAMHAYKGLAKSYGPDMGHDVLQKLRHDIGDSEELRLMGLTDREEQKILLDLGVADVHQPMLAPNYAAGFRIAEGAADVISPPVLVPNQSNYYFTWNSTNDFNRKNAAGGAPGGEVAEVNPAGTFTQYSALEYALGGFLPTEVEANADAPLRPFSKLTQMVVDALLLEREIRVAGLLQTSGNWGSNLVNTITSGSQWDGGASSDPIANLHKAIEQSYMPMTGLVMSELVFHDMVRNTAVQKYITYKDPVTGLPSPDDFKKQFGLPPITVACMKYVTGGNLTYVWGNHVVGYRLPGGLPPTSQMDIATSLTFRWNGKGGASIPDAGNMSAGFLVRNFFDQKRGPRGGTKVVCVHNDIEVQATSLVGTLILNAHI